MGCFCEVVRTSVLLLNFSRGFGALLSMLIFSPPAAEPPVGQSAVYNAMRNFSIPRLQGKFKYGTLPQIGTFFQNLVVENTDGVRFHLKRFVSCSNRNKGHHVFYNLPTL